MAASLRDVILAKSGNLVPLPPGHSLPVRLLFGVQVAPGHHQNEEAVQMASTKTKGKGKGKASTQAKPKEQSARAQQLTRLKGMNETQLRAELTKHEKAYKAYQVKRAEGVKRGDNPHRVGYTAWKQAYAELLRRGKGLKGTKIERSKETAEATA